MKKKLIKKILISVTGIILLLALYSFSPYVIDVFARPYNLKKYKEKIVEKQKRLPVNYYLAPDGNDNNDGKTQKTAWRSISMINETEFNPGDSILLKGEQIFYGNMVFDEDDLGTSKNPIFVGSYGKGKATVDAGKGTGIQVLNGQGFHFSNLTIKGAGLNQNEGSGLALLNNLRGDIKLDFIKVDSVEAYGFGYWGIVVNGNRNKSGFRNLQIEYCLAHDNGDAGVYIYGEFDLYSKNYAHENVTIRNVVASNNPGRVNSKKNTGSGIVMSDTKNGLIEKCVAYSNGFLCTSNEGGPVGIWVWDSNNIIVQYNKSYNNKTGGKLDGGGFDLDGGTSNSVLQYNYSQDNDGAGFFLAQFTYARKNDGNIVRYNVSINDGRKNNYQGVNVWGNVTNASIYNNTILISSSQSSKPYGILIHQNTSPGYNNSTNPENILVANNLFLSSGDVTSVGVLIPKPKVKFINNNYYSFSNSLRILWDDKLYNSLSEWRDSTLQEKDGLNNYGLSVDPNLIDSTFEAVVSFPYSEKTMRSPGLEPGSQVINKGIDVQKIHNVRQPINTDINGTSIPQESRFDMGASEFKH